MKKNTLVLFCVVFAISAQAQQWVETFGPDDAVKNGSNYWPFVGSGSVNYIYTNYDHATDCIYEGSNATVRKVSSSSTNPGLGNHVWLTVLKPANPPTYPDTIVPWFRISGMNRLTSSLSFDLAPSIGGYTPNIKLYINEEEIDLSSIYLPTLNIMQTITIPVNKVINSIKIENYDPSNGIRVDNITIGLPTLIQSDIIYEIDLNNKKAFVVGANQSIISAPIAGNIMFNSISYPVVEITQSAFANKTNLTSVTIPSSITTIGAGAFLNCGKLSSINIPDNVEIIGNEAFWGTGLTSITFNANLCSDFEYSKSPFNNLSNLQTVTIGEKVRSIPAYFLENCAKITSISIPSGVSSIGEGAFYTCSGLTSVVWNIKYTTSFTDTRSPFYNAYNNHDLRGQITSFTFGDSVQSIPDYLCSGMKNLRSITIGKTVTRFGDNVFMGCTGLTSVEWNAKDCPYFTDTNSPFYYYDSDYYYGYKMDNTSFDLRGQITSFKFGNSVQIIPAYLCSGMKNLQSITIGNSVIYGVGYGFEDCISLEKIEVSTGNSVYHSINNCIIETPTKTLILGCKNSIIPTDGSVTSIGDGAFRGCVGLTSITIPSGVTSIGYGAFRGCRNLTSVIWDSKNCLDFTLVETPFYNSNGYPDYDLRAQITSFTFGKSVERIPAYLCSGMSNLQSLIISNNVTSIGNGAFSNCSGLTSVVWNAKNCSDLSYIGEYEVPQSIEIFGKTPPPITSFIFGSEVIHVPAFVCQNMTKLTSISIPSSVTSIGDRAFNGCTNLKRVNITDLAAWCNVTISNSMSNPLLITKKLYLNDVMVTQLVIPNTVYTIKPYTFMGAECLTSVVIPNNVTNIGTSAFSATSLASLAFNAIMCDDFSDYDSPFKELTTLSSVTIGDGVKHIPAYFLERCTSVSSLIIPGSVTSIGQGAFYSCVGLTSINLPSNITSIGDRTFAYCNSLTALIIPNSVRSVGNEAFYNCSKTIFTPKSFLNVETIGSYAFYGCNQLTEIELPLIKAIPLYTFANCTELFKALFGQNLKTVGENAFANCAKLTRITCYATIVPSASSSSFANYNGYLSVPCEVLEEYSVDIVFGTFKNIQCVSADPTNATTGVTVVADASEAIFTWPASGSAQFYTLVINKDDVVFCTLRFNGNGQLLGLAFAPSSVTESKSITATLTSAGYQFSVTGLNSASLYSYQLKVLDANNNELASYVGQFSTDGYVGLKQTEYIEGVYAQNGTVVVENCTNLPVSIYDVTGRLVATGSSLTQHFAIPRVGVYLVKVGEQTMKLLVP